jgi:hypothetical protein
MPSKALLSGSVEAVVATFVIRLGRLGARSGFGLRDLLAADVTASGGRVSSSVLVAQVSLMWILYPFQKVSRLAAQRASVS